MTTTGTTVLDEAKALYRRGELEPALAAYERAAELSPEDPEPCFAAGVILDKLGKPDEAIAALEKALARKPSFGKAYVNLAAAHAEAGRFYEARKVIERGLEIGDRAQHKMLEELLSQLLVGICKVAREARARAEAALTSGAGAGAGASAMADFDKLVSGLSALAGEKAVAAELIRDEDKEPTFLVQGEKRKLAAQLGPAGSILMADAESGAIVTQIVLEPDTQWASKKFGGGEPGAAKKG